MTTNRTRYHVGMNEIGLDSEYRIECLGDLDGARAWLEADIENTAEGAEDRSEFDACLAKLATIPDAEIVGEHRIDAYLFWVRAVEDCGCPCDCAETGRADTCDSVHNREAAPEPKLAEPDADGRSTFEFDGAQYAVFNTASTPLDGYWAVSRIPADRDIYPSRDYLGAGISTRENAFALAVEKLRPTRLITFRPRQFRDAFIPDEEREEYPTVTVMDWVLAWNDEGSPSCSRTQSPAPSSTPTAPSRCGSFAPRTAASTTSTASGSTSNGRTRRSRPDPRRPRLTDHQGVSTPPRAPWPDGARACSASPTEPRSAPPGQVSASPSCPTALTASSARFQPAASNRRTPVRRSPSRPPVDTTRARTFPRSPSGGHAPGAPKASHGALPRPERTSPPMSGTPMNSANWASC
ncbi:hypothetical protein ACWCQQ_32885 [Streptomyces sp. NPDC002143]